MQYDFSTQKVAILSPPWQLYNRPSIQLGVLKADLKKKFPALDVISIHPYLDIAAGIGYDLYQAVSERTWLAETVFAALLFPDQREKIEKLFKKLSAGKRVLKDVSFIALIEKVENITQKIICRTDWPELMLAGFSISVCQLTSGIYFIQEIRKIAPELPIVAGGSAVSGMSPKDLSTLFKDVDFFVQGEGELPFEKIVCQVLKREMVFESPGVINRSLYRRNRQSCSSRDKGKSSDKKNMKRRGLAGKNQKEESSFLQSHQKFFQNENLDDLSCPDYEDYFYQLANLPPLKKFFPTLLLESSRGCWWNSTKKKNPDRGCAFCNLNLQWQGYRSKSPRKIASEISLLSEKHQILSFAFVDNVLSRDSSKEIFEKIYDLKRDFNLFCELRADTKREIISAMGRAGVSNVQIGIEALSNSLLKKFRKGTTTIQNLEIMRTCEELRIVNNANMLIQFPGSDENDIQETLKAMEYALYFRPLKIVAFQPGSGSRVLEKTKEYGVTASFNHYYYKIIFPVEIERKVKFIQQSIRADTRYQKKLWRPVIKKLDQWKSRYASLHEQPGFNPILSYRDGGSFLIIKQRLSKSKVATHRLEGLSRRVYLYCRKNRSSNQILHHFNGLLREVLDSFLTMMVDKKLMYSEKERHLSLAIKSTFFSG